MSEKNLFEEILISIAKDLLASSQRYLDFLNKEENQEDLDEEALKIFKELKKSMLVSKENSERQNDFFLKIINKEEIPFEYLHELRVLITLAEEELASIKKKSALNKALFSKTKEEKVTYLS